MTIIIAAMRVNLEDCWDVVLAVQSALFYSNCNVFVAFKGIPENILPVSSRLTTKPQPEFCNSFGEAFEWARQQVKDDDILLMNDDCVLLPNTVDILLEDKALLENHGNKIGFLATRSNYILGVQNIRCDNGGKLSANKMRYDTEDVILPAKRVSPVFAYTSKQALDAIGGFPPINWLSDDLMCSDFENRGYQNFVSRAYVHHIGERASKQQGETQKDLLDAGMKWVKENRPDFWRKITQ